MGFRDSDWLLLGLAWVLGLSLGSFSPWGGFLALALGVLLAGLRYFKAELGSIGFQRWPVAPPVRLWLLAGLVGLVASGYFWLRWPQPGTNDISRLVPRLSRLSPPPLLQVSGRVTEPPLLNRSGKLRLILAAQSYEGVGAGREFIPTGTTAGLVYVTIPPEQAQDLHPGDTVAVTGRLYRPEAGGRGAVFQGFDFRRYLQSQEIFAGLAGRELQRLRRGPGWGWWALRERIANAQVQSLGPAAGPVVSSMVLGNRAIQVPFPISDQFRRVGLSHALAASGFQVSLILGAVLALVRQRSQRQQFLVGAGALLLFGALSGFAPAVLRAVLMGLASLVALLGKTRLRPGPILLALACLMLLWQPGWIADLGFQFSFLASLGLVVSAAAIGQRLDWLPPALAEAVAVPLAATLWVLPLQLLVFGVFPLYGLLVNILTAPLLTVITIGGFISGLAALLWPGLGALLAWPLSLPTGLLLWLVEWFARLPGSAIATGALGSWQFFLLYGLLLAVWLVPGWQRQGQLAAWVGVCLVVLPFWQLQTQGLRVTVLPHPRLPMLVIQAPGANIVINSGGGGLAQQTESFLTLQGVSTVDLGIATDRRGRFQTGWLQLHQQFGLRRFTEVPTVRRDEDYRQLLQKLPASVQQQPWQLGQTLTLGPTQLKLLRTDPVALQMTIASKTWLLLSEPPSRQGAADSSAIWLAGQSLPPVQVLWWLGQPLPTSLVQQLRPETIIVSEPVLEVATHPQGLAQTGQFWPQVFQTEVDGAIQWTPRGGFVANQVQGE